jgi:hypothetical protein
VVDEPKKDKPSVEIAIAVYVETVLGGGVPLLGGTGVIGVMQFVPSSSCPLGQVSVAVAA